MNAIARSPSTAGTPKEGDMRAAVAGRLAIAFFSVQTIAVVYPGLVPFSRIEPRVLGLPFSMAWLTFWIVASALVLWGVSVVEGRSRRED